MKTTLGLGKYRDLLLAILLFIVLDVGILAFNFYASIQIERDATRINSAGELRMLTQQITKSLLTLQVERKGDLPIQTSMAQLTQGQLAFRQALAAVKGSLGSDIEFTLFGLDPERLREAVRKLEREWLPLDESITPVAVELTPALEDVEIAVNKAVARNIRLAGFSDDVATVVQAASRTKTQRMRQIQVAAILLALLNFIYIVFKFLRRLNASDRVAEAARRETEDILNTVTEGLLLVRPDGRVGSQFSASVRTLFMRDLAAGDDFRLLLARMLDAGRADEAANFVQLLFDPKVKPTLLAQLDPLRDVEVRPPEGSKEPPRFLTFQFTQVRAAGAVKELLVTVFDVTQRVRLERELAVSQEAARGSVDDLIRVLENEPALLHDFLFDARDKLADLNHALREVGRRPRDYLRLVEEAARTIHGVKGEAGTLSLSSVARQAHQMEDVLAPLRTRRDLAGEDLIPVVVELSRLQDQVERLHKVFTRLSGAGAAPASGPQLVDGMVRSLQSLSERVASSMRKQVRLTAKVNEGELPPEVTQVLRETLPQLVRNAIVHGIESPQERQTLGKSPVGELRLEIVRREDGQIDVVLSDDGRGISVAQVRERAAALRQDAARMTDSQILGFIFDPSFSTATEVTEHAGRGDGLALVRQLAERAGAKLRVMTQPSAYTRFILQFRAA
jgi:two-component system chemotaxis sensor kinase CheA